MIWIPDHPELGWAPGTVISIPDDETFEVED